MTAGVRSSAHAALERKKTKRDRRGMSFMNVLGVKKGNALREKKAKESRIEVDHKDVVEDGFENGNESFVVRVREVYRACLLVFEGHDKAVGESFVKPFGAIVLAPFERPDAGNLSFQGGEFPFDFSDRGGIGIFFELKAHDVTDALF